MHGGSELAELSTTLNALIEDLRSSISRERRITADAAHELRTPLAVLAAQVELAERRPEHADLADVHASVGRLTRLADVLLALSRADSTEAAPAEVVSVGELVTEAMAAVDHGHLLAPGDVLVDLELADPLDETALAPIDVTAFSRILTNLIGNSLAAGPDEAVVVRLETTGGALVLRVSDDGPGVPDDFLPFAFDRFARTIGARSTGMSGAGLGLALVKRLAERSGGTARLANSASRGAVATVRIPLQRGRPQQWERLKSRAPSRTRILRVPDRSPRVGELEPPHREPEGPPMSTTASTTERRSVAPGARRAFAILTGIATLFVFIQFFTSSEFIRSEGDGAETWTNIHGFTAYGLLVPALVAAAIAIVALRRTAPVLTVVSVLLFVASIGQWGTGHLISTLHLDGWTPFHVFFSSVVLALAIWASIRSAALRRG